MSDLMMTVNRWRIVRDAFLEFVTLGALDRLLAEPITVERFHRDIQTAANKIEISDVSFVHRLTRYDD